MEPRFTLAAACCLILSGCGVGNVASAPPQLSFSDSQLRPLIEADARRLGIVDGFFFGEEARNFKTPYLLTTPELKTDFALAYEQMLTDSNENMLKNWQSYVPYSKRSQFARKWWTDHSEEFGKQSEKMKILWIHESMLDGSELWFRAIEKLNKGNIDSPSVLAHDEEQRMVFKYAENDHSEGSLSSQFH
jgi:hypothetical protein